MRKKVPKILITGGAGFIGSHFVKEAVKRGLKPIVVDKLTYCGDLKRLAGIEKRYKFYQTDICKRLAMESIFAKERPDYVVNFAAESIPEDIYVPVQSVPTIGTRMIMFGELWKEQAKNNKPQKNERGEAIFLRGKQTKVLSFLNGGQWMPVRAITRHWYKGKIIKLIQKHGIIEATPNHSIYSSNLELTNPNNNPELLVIREINRIRKKCKRKSLALLEILAAYITEGNVTFNKANGGYIIEINQTAKEWIEYIGELIKKEFALKFYVGKHRKKGRKDVYYLQVSNKEFFNYLVKNCGKYCDGKFFPDWIFDLEFDQQNFFWKKLLEGDGTKDGRYSTTSYKLANQVSFLLTLQGKEFKVFECDRKNCKRSWEFKTELCGQHYGLTKRKKEEIEYEGWVYDLEVEKSYNFACGIGNIVCHNTHVDRSIQDATSFVETNIKGTQLLLDASKRFNVKRFIHISSDETYGKIEEGKFTENSPLMPNSPYSASKAAADFFVRAYIYTYNFSAIIVRPSNNYGPGQYPEKFIPVIIYKALRNERVPVYAKGKQIREWLYVQDCVRAIFVVLNKGKLGEIYNIGTSNEKKNIEVAERIIEKLGKSKDLIQFVKDRPGHDFRYSVNCDKLKKLGWMPKNDFDQGLDKTINWYQENKKWLDKKARSLKNYWKKVYKL